MRGAVLACLLAALALTGGSFAQARADDRPTGPATRCEDFSSIGTATMDDKRVLTLRVFTLPPGPIGHGTLVYEPEHPQYQAVLKHLGPISPGRTVNVRPWC